MKNKITAQVYLFQELWQNLKHFMRGHFIQHKPFISDEWPDMTLSGQKVYNKVPKYIRYVICTLKPEKSFQAASTTQNTNNLLSDNTMMQQSLIERS